MSALGVSFFKSLPNKSDLLRYDSVSNVLYEASFQEVYQTVASRAYEENRCGLCARRKSNIRYIRIQMCNYLTTSSHIMNLLGCLTCNIMGSRSARSNGVSYVKEQSVGLTYCKTRYFRGRKFSRKVNLRYFREKIFSRIYCSRENIFPRKYLPAKVSSRENIFPRKYLPANCFRAANM